MEYQNSFSINEIGKVSGRHFTGSFTVKLTLTRADQFAADARRREILGPRPNDALDALKLEAFMLGQLSVRVIKAPKFWEDSNGGVLLEDFEVVQKVFDEAVRLENERLDAIQRETSDALKELARREQEKEKDEQRPVSGSSGSRP